MILICHLNNFTQIYINIYYSSTLCIYFVTAYAKVLPTNNPNIILEKCVFIFLFKQQEIQFIGNTVNLYIGNSVCASCRLLRHLVEGPACTSPQLSHLNRVGKIVISSCVFLYKNQHICHICQHLC